MIYRQEGSLWRVSDNWQPQLVAEHVPGANLSPDGQLALFQQGDDLWLTDLATGQESNLTQDSGRRHCCSQWWPSQPGRIVFGSWPTDADLGPSTGFLSIMNVDGSDYTVLDEEVQSNGLPAPSPDGQTIAYDRTGTAWFYRPDAEATSLDPAAFGLNDVVRIGGPAWSPDGHRIAWTVAVQDPEWRIALAIFDLETSSAWLLHPYQNIGRGGWFPPPAWSPDGRWLAFVAEDMEPEKRGLWVVATGGEDEHYLGSGAKPLWSPDGRWLTYTAYPDPASGQDSSALLVESGSWYTIHLSLPPGAEIIHWLE
jgi:Tol biopolymer transport system component